MTEIGDSMAAAVGDDRIALLYRHASFLRAGLRVPASSDRPCVTDGHPLRGMAATRSRRTAGGWVLAVDEAVDGETALRAATVDAAWIAGDEDVRGRLAPGFLADLALLGDDPTRTDPDLLGDIEVVATFCDGVPTHGADVLRWS